MNEKNKSLLKGDESSPISSTEKLTLEEIVFLAHKVGLDYAAAKKKVDQQDMLKTVFRSKLMESIDLHQNTA